MSKTFIFMPLTLHGRALLGAFLYIFAYQQTHTDMKIRLELVINEEPDGRKFLNYWDNRHGNDVCCELKDGKLLESQFDEDANELLSREISISEFVSAVEKIVKDYK